MDGRSTENIFEIRSVKKNKETINYIIEDRKDEDNDILPDLLFYFVDNLI